jgi:hypothetical protein
MLLVSLSPIGFIDGERAGVRGKRLNLTRYSPQRDSSTDIPSIFSCTTGDFAIFISRAT